MLRLEVVSCARDGQVLLDRVTLSVGAGEMVLVSGGRGAGKSLLLAIAAARSLPDRGAVWIGERRLQDLQRSSLPFVRRNIGYLPAAPPLLEGETVVANMRLALAVRGLSPAAATEAAEASLSALGLAWCAQRRVRALSSGERRLVALARALAGSPPAVVVDEPAAGLGPEDRTRVVDALAGARDDGAAVLCGTTDEALAQGLHDRGARRTRLEEGRLLAAASMSLVPHPGQRSSQRSGAEPQAEREDDEEGQTRDPRRSSVLPGRAGGDGSRGGGV